MNGYNSGVSLTRADNGQYVGLGFNYGRPQTVPNEDTKIIDHWEGLPWGDYQLPNNGNRFFGNFPKMSLVKTPQ